MIQLSSRRGKLDVGDLPGVERWHAVGQFEDLVHCFWRATFTPRLFGSNRYVTRRYSVVR